MPTFLTVIAALFFLSAVVPFLLLPVIELQFVLLYLLIAFGFGFVLVALAAIIAGLRGAGVKAR